MFGKWWRILGIVFSIALVTSGAILVQKPRETAKSKAAAASTVSINPSTLTKNMNDAFSVNVDIDTGQNTVSAADVEIVYDATKLQGISITAGNFLPTVLVAGQIGSGKARIVVAGLGPDPLTGSSPATKKGVGTLAKIDFKVLTASGTTQISFSSKTQAAATGENVNVIIGMNPSNITIATAPTPTPTVTPTTTATPTATTTSTATPTATPTATGPRRGDVDGNGIVNIVDLGMVIDHFDSSPPGDPRTDLNNDGIVNIVDIGIVIDNLD